MDSKTPEVWPIEDGGTPKIPILFQDDVILAINKPAGLLSIPDGYNPALPHVAGCLAPLFGRCWIVHRLDRDTSGVMILARTPAAHRELNIQFEQRQVKKIYHAFVQGQPEWTTILVDTPLRVNGDRKHRTVAAPLTGKAARRISEILERFPWGCLIEAQPHTGYTHQIRAHLATIGFPILADRFISKFWTGPKGEEHLKKRRPLPSTAWPCMPIRSISPIPWRRYRFNLQLPIPRIL